MRTWKLHNKLIPEQLEYASTTGKIMSSGFITEATSFIRSKSCPEYGTNVA
jgi:hypothetical protein